MLYFPLLFQKDLYRSRTTWGGLGETRKAFGLYFQIFILLKLSTRPNSRRDGDWENGQRQMRVLFQDLSSEKEPGVPTGCWSATCLLHRRTVVLALLPPEAGLCSVACYTDCGDKSFPDHRIPLPSFSTPFSSTQAFCWNQTCSSPHSIIIALRAGTLNQSHRILHKQTSISLSRWAQMSNNSQALHHRSKM